MDEEKKKSYLQERVFDLCGLTREQVSLPLKWHKQVAEWRNPEDFDKETGMGRVYMADNGEGTLIPQWPLFQSDQDDNIRMYPYTLDGKLISYVRDKQPKYAGDMEVEDLYYITRLSPKNWEEARRSDSQAGKYRYPGGETKKGTYPFFPPELYRKYLKKEHIETVILTEGYMKAMVASVHDMAVIGLGSVTLYKDGKTKQLYPDIVRFLNTVKPDNIIILYDGDCTNPWKTGGKETWRETPDLSKRPQSFMHSLLNLKDLLLEFKNAQGNPCEIFFAYVNKMLDDEEKTDERTGETYTVNNSPKGLDDLIVDEKFKDEVQAIADDLNHPGRTGIYFIKKNLRTCNDGNIRAIFNLQSPEEFYKAWEPQIKGHDFKYKGATYRYLESEKKLVQLLDQSLKDYVAIGSDIVLVTEKPIPGAKSGTVQDFYTIADKVINAQYGKGTSEKLYKYKHYISTTVEPDHVNYSREIINSQNYRFYNIYSPLPSKPVEGRWPHIEKLLHQITKEYPEEKFHYYEMLLDWITVAYFYPREFLPIIMLVSRDRATGKTSFLNLLKAIFGNNTVIGDNNLLDTNFNSMLAGKLIVGIDESCLGENKAVGEKLKYLSTTQTILVERKGKDKQEVPSFLKFVLCSNEVRKAVFIAKDEIRFWVMRLSPWADDNGLMEGDDPTKKYSEYIEEEVPAFIFFLQERFNSKQMFVKEREGSSRMWFDPKRIYNDDLAKMMNGTASNFEGSLMTFLEEMFKDTGAMTLEFDTDYIQKYVPDAARKDQNYIRTLLSDMPGVTKSPDSHRVRFPMRLTEADKLAGAEGDIGSVYWCKDGKQCRPFIFNAEYFVSPQDLEEMKSRKVKTDSAAAQAQATKKDDSQTEVQF